eukprot:scaffold1336_cov379-Prasinococcus_capsulatus_cf.AAC.6
MLVTLHVTCGPVVQTDGMYKGTALGDRCVGCRSRIPHATVSAQGLGPAESSRPAGHTVAARRAERHRQHHHSSGVSAATPRKALDDWAAWAGADRAGQPSQSAVCPAVCGGSAPWRFGIAPVAGRVAPEVLGLHGTKSHGLGALRCAELKDTVVLLLAETQPQI